MGSLFDQLAKRGVLKKGTYPSFVRNSIHYETIMGSIAYGANTDTSDFDVYALCIPPKEMIFPHLAGYVPGFGKPPPKFKTLNLHHLYDKESEGGKGRNYDLTVYSIVEYFQLCMQCNPNMIDSLFTPRRCILFSTQIGELIRENRHLFLHKGAWFKFKGYAYSQCHKMKSQERIGKRAKLVEEFGYDTKFASHVVRLMNEIEQILVEGDLTLDKNREQLKAIKRGDWTLEQVEKYFEDKEKQLEEAYIKSELPKYPDEARLKRLLLQCLEMTYDGLEDAVQLKDTATVAVQEILEVLHKYNLGI